MTQAEILRVQELMRMAQGYRDNLDAMVELLEIYSGQVNAIFHHVTAAAGEEKQTVVKELWRQAVDAVNNVIQAKGSIPDFKKALGAWADAQFKLVEEARPAPKPKRKREVGITEKQQKFIQHYPECLNGSEAARRAGYSKRSAAEIGYENMKNLKIRAAIDELIAAGVRPGRYYKTI